MSFEIWELVIGSAFLVLVLAAIFSTKTIRDPSDPRNFD